VVPKKGEDKRLQKLESTQIDKTLRNPPDQKTAKGKAALARNAIKHGLCSMEAVSESNSHTTGEQTSEDNRLGHHHKCDPLGGKLKNKPNRGRDALGTRGRDVRDTKQSQKPASGGKSETTEDKDQKYKLKKQSQFAASRTSATLSVIKDYGDNPPATRVGNKANQACPERSRRSQSERGCESGDAGKSGTQALSGAG